VTGSQVAGRRVVVVNWRDPWHRLAGGSERYAWEIAGALRDAGARVELWTARDEGQVAAEDRDGVRVRRRGGPYTFYGFVWARILGERLRRRRPDVVLDMDCGIPSFTPLVLGKGTVVLLVVHHVHQEQFRIAMRRPVSDLGRVLERRAMPAVYRDVTTLAVSASTVAEMRAQLGWRGDVRVLHNGTDPAPEKSVVPVANRVVVFGRVVAHKRVDLVVRAVAEVRRRRPGLTLDVIGTGDELDRVRSVVHELGLGDVVRLHGFLEDAEKSRALAAARLHVCASDAEGWGQVVLEAAAHGVPTLARDVPGMRDSVRDGVTGWLLPEPGGETAAALVARLAEGIGTALTALDDPAVRTGTAAECRAWSARFGWERTRAEAVDIVSAQLCKLLPPRG
jgi:glycosyltransferase involved in cell wall biosynthesis